MTLRRSSIRYISNGIVHPEDGAFVPRMWAAIFQYRDCRRGLSGRERCITLDATYIKVTGMNHTRSTPAQGYPAREIDQSAESSVRIGRGWPNNAASDRSMSER